MSTKVTIGVLDFSTALAAALSLEGGAYTATIISDHDLPRFHEAFKAAYDVVEESIGNKVIRFNLILGRIHGTTPVVHEITSWWLMSGWATRDSPGILWRIWIDPEIAERLLNQEFPGGAVVWKQAASAFLNHLRS